jgi:hypothetical protein
MIHACTSAVTMLVVSTIYSGAVACESEGLAKNFTRMKDEELQWKMTTVDDFCAVVAKDEGVPDAVEGMRQYFKKHFSDNSMSRGTIDGCSAEQITEAAC